MSARRTDTNDISTRSCKVGRACRGYTLVSSTSNGTASPSNSLGRVWTACTGRAGRIRWIWEACVQSQCNSSVSIIFAFVFSSYPCPIFPEAFGRPEFVKLNEPIATDLSPADYAYSGSPASRYPARELRHWTGPELENHLHD